MDCIVWVEALQNHDPPVRVYFEQENLDTMARTSSIILIVLAMVAQEESQMKSEAVYFGEMMILLVPFLCSSKQEGNR